MIKKFSSPKIEYELVAERSEANQNSLTFPFWCRGEDSNLHVSWLTKALKAFASTIPPPRRVEISFAYSRFGTGLPLHYSSFQKFK